MNNNRTGKLTTVSKDCVLRSGSVRELGRSGLLVGLRTDWIGKWGELRVVRPQRTKAGTSDLLGGGCVLLQTNYIPSNELGEVLNNTWQSG